MNKTKSIYVYTNKGKFVEEFFSQKTFREKHLPLEIGKTPIFINTITSKKFTNKKYTTLKYGVINELYVFEERVYRDDVAFIDKVYNSKLCNKHHLRNEPIQLVNLNGDLIGEFINRSVLAHLIPEYAKKRSSMTRQLSNINKGTIRFYKDKEIFIKNKN